MTNSFSDLARPRNHFPVAHTESEWRTLLSPEAYHVLRKHGTERAGTSKLDSEKRRGLFICAACHHPLFHSDTKFESHTGWPSFFRALDGGVETRNDQTLFMPRTEVHCRQCGGHLGHVFEDGPAPTGQRFCMNGVAMGFDPE